MKKTLLLTMIVAWIISLAGCTKRDNEPEKQEFFEEEPNAEVLSYYKKIFLNSKVFTNCNDISIRIYKDEITVIVLNDYGKASGSYDVCGEIYEDILKYQYGTHVPQYDYEIKIKNESVEGNRKLEKEDIIETEVNNN